MDEPKIDFEDPIIPKTLNQLVEGGNKLNPDNTGLAPQAQDIFSPNYKKNQVGWRLKSNGEAEFNNVAIREASITDTPITTVRTMMLMSHDGKPRNSNGCSGPNVAETSTNKVNYSTLDFDTSTTEYAFWNIKLPDWNGTACSYRLYWTNALGSAGNKVNWEIRNRFYSDGDFIEGALTSSGNVTDTLIALRALHVTDWVSVSVDGSGGYAYIQVNRNPSHADDNMGGDAFLMAVEVQYTAVVQLI
jgi:hypothetical protein